MWQKRNVNDHADAGQELQFIFTLKGRMKKKSDLCDSDRGMDAGARWAG